MSGIKDVAKRAGVSISTVSNVLNKSRYVSPELARRVEQAVKELDYEVNPIARGMKSNRSGSIGVITEDMCGVFYPYVVKGINSVATEKGYQIIIGDTQGASGEKAALDREKRMFARMIASRVDGIIFVSAVSNKEKGKYFAQIQKQASQYKKIPIVSMERDFTDLGIDSVYFDAFENAKKAVHHLIDCGCRRIGHITGAVAMEVAKERVLGYRSCMLERQMELDEERQIVQGDYTHRGGYAAMKKLLRQCPDVDGVFCGNDQMGIGALRALEECGKKVPEDIRLIGYDDVFIARVVNPPLSTIHIQKYHAGIEAAKLLFERIENGEEEWAAQAKKMEAQLVVRRSTMADAPDEALLEDW